MNTLSSNQYSVVIPMTVAERIIFQLLKLPYQDVVDLVDELNNACKYKCADKNLIDD